MYFFDGRIRYSETDSEGKLTLMSLLNYFQDCSIFHSEDVGLGMDYLSEHHMVWVLCSWQIVIERYPKVCERVKIGTAPYKFKSFLGYRNFVMETEEGECLAKANSLWSLLDTDAGKTTAPPIEMIQGYTLYDRLEMDYATRRIIIPEGGRDEEGIIVKKHHLDSNNHVNNGQFVDMAMEFLPSDFTVGQMRAEYKKQAFLNDTLYPHVAMENGRAVVSLKDGTGSPYAVVEFTEGHAV